MSYQQAELAGDIVKPLCYIIESSPYNPLADPFRRLYVRRAVTLPSLNHVD